MPDTSILLKVLRVVLEYGMLIWLLMFVVRIARWLFRDVKQEFAHQKPPEVQNHEAVLAILSSEAGEEELVKKRFAFSEQITLGRGAAIETFRRFAGRIALGRFRKSTEGKKQDR